MSAQTVSSAVEKREQGPSALVSKSEAWFARVVPSHVDPAAFVAMTLAHLRRNPSLAKAAEQNPQAFMAGVSECARLGLVLGDTFHLVPFGGDITGVIDYTGEIELIYRAGAVASVKAEIVYSGDQFRFTTDMDRPEHAPDWFGDRGELVGAYAYAVMKDGATSKVVIYSKAEIDQVRSAATGASRSDSPWNKWYDRMALKTVIHRLEKFVPTSAEFRREQLRAAAEVSQQVNTATGEVVDAEIVDEQDASPASPPPRAADAPHSPHPGQDAGEAHE